MNIFNTYRFNYYYMKLQDECLLGILTSQKKFNNAATAVTALDLMLKGLVSNTLLLKKGHL